MLNFAKGDATAPSGKSARIICHVCNDLGRWGSGFVLAISKRWPEPEASYRDWYGRKDGTFALGEIQVVKVDATLWVANMVAQHGIKMSKSSGPPIRYESLEKCLSKLAIEANKRKASVHMPRIGCGLAGGDWATVEDIVKRTLVDKSVAVTVYDLDLAGAKKWQLWRQDDGGNQYLVESFTTESAANKMMKKCEERGHKQVYWVKAS